MLTVEQANTDRNSWRFEGYAFRLIVV